MLNSIRTRYLITLAILTGLSLLAWFHAITAIRGIVLEAGSVMPRVVRILDSLEYLADTARTLDGMARNIASSADADALRELDRVDAEFRQSLRQAKYEVPRPLTTEEALYARRILERYDHVIGELRRLATLGMPPDSRLATYESQLHPVFDLIAEDATHLKTMTRHRLDQFLEQTRHLSRQSTWRMVLILLAAVAVTGVSMYFFERNVHRPIRRLRALTHMLRDGDPNTPIDLPPECGGSDEIARLVQTTNAMIEARASSERELGRAAEALAASDALNRAIIASISDCVVVIDPHYRVIMVNEAFATQFAAHFDVRPQPGMNLLELLDPFPEDRAKAAALWGRALAGESFHVTQEITGHADAAIIYDIGFDTLRDARGFTLGALHTARDVTTQARQSLALKDNAAELDRRARDRTNELTGIMESIPAIIWIARDPDCRVITGNKAASEFMGLPRNVNLSLTPEDARPRSQCAVFMAGRPVAPADLPMQRAGREGIIFRGVELEMRFADGRTRYLFGTASPMRDESGTITGVIGAFVDITDRKNLEREVCQAKDMAETVSLAKSRFLADVSHEIRTPLNAVIGMADMLLRMPLEPETEDCARTIRKAAGHLLDLLNDILDLSKIEADKLRPQNVIFSLPDLLEAVVSTFSLVAREKGTTLTLHTDPGLPETLFGDGRRLRQILINLVSNAVKFTDHGGISLRVKRMPPRPDQDAARILLAFIVTDTGIGIAPDKLSRVFDDFTQAHDAPDGEYGGTGLGLAISRHLARMLGGDIAVVSREGKGSIFTATAAFQPATATESPASGEIGPDDRGASPHRSGKILLVEDNPVNIKVAQLHLEKMGHAVTVADTGLSALEILSREDFDVVFMDLEMPGMDGIEATRRIRAAEADRGLTATPIVAMTAHVLDEVRERCLAAGMVDFVAKPVNFFTLEALIDRLLSRTPASRPLSPPLFDRETAKRTMGIDEATLAPIFLAALEEFGELAEALQLSAETGEIREMRMLAHTLKSIAGTLGFSRGMAILGDISAALRADDLATARALVKELGNLFGQGLLEFQAT